MQVPVVDTKMSQELPGYVQDRPQESLHFLALPADKQENMVKPASRSHFFSERKRAASAVSSTLRRNVPWQGFV